MHFYSTELIRLNWIEWHSIKGTWCFLWKIISYDCKTINLSFWESHDIVLQQKKKEKEKHKVQDFFSRQCYCKSPKIMEWI